MATINISLVGGQPMPVFALILDQEPDQIFLVHSEQTKALAERLKDNIKRKLPKTAIVLQELEVGLQDADRNIRAFAQAWCPAGSEVTVNLSGGTKPWSLLFYRHFSQQDNAKCVFIDQNNVVWNMKTLENHKANLDKLQLDDIFSLNSVRITSKTNLNDYTPKDRSDCKRIEQLYLTNWSAMWKMTNQLADMGGRGRAANGKSEIWYDYEENAYVCKVVSANGNKENNLTLRSPHNADMLLSTGWFETKVALFLERWKMAKQIWLNVHFGSGSTNNDQNEVDIIIETTAGKLLFVECKTKVHNITDINKFNDVVRNNGGQGSKKVFITRDPMTGDAKVKAEQVGMPHYALNTISQPANEPVFFDWLSDYMSDINEK